MPCQSGYIHPEQPTRASADRPEAGWRFIANATRQPQYLELRGLRASGVVGKDCDECTAERGEIIGLTARHDDVLLAVARLDFFIDPVSTRVEDVGSEAGPAGE